MHAWRQPPVYRIVTSRMEGNKRDSTRRVVPRFVLNLVITVVITSYSHRVHSGRLHA